MAEKTFRLFIVGAGFSRLAGFPLGPELWQMLLPRIDSAVGRDNHVRRDLESFRKYKKEAHGVELADEAVDFEEFMGFLDIEHFLGLRGSDTWSTNGNQAQILVKSHIGKILTEHLHGLDEIPGPYLAFAKALRPNDIILTFNYDSLLEVALELADQPYRLFPDRYSSVGITANTVDTSQEEVVLIKLHGSADWFSRRSYSEREEVAAETAAAGRLRYTPTDAVFGPDRLVQPVPLVDGPRADDDSLTDIYRVLDPTPLYRDSNPRAVPLILAPSNHKIVYASPLLDFWYGLGHGGSWRLDLAIIGFSLPDHDEYLRQILWSLTRSYTDVWWNEDFAGVRKRPLKLVDYRITDIEINDFRRRFQFLNWKRTQLYLDGFGEDAVRFLFD